MGIDNSKYGISNEDIRRAALGDFNDFDPINEKKVDEVASPGIAAAEPVVQPVAPVAQPVTEPVQPVKKTVDVNPVDPAVSINTVVPAAAVADDTTTVAKAEPKKKIVDIDSGKAKVVSAGKKVADVAGSFSEKMAIGADDHYLIAFVKSLFTKNKIGVAIWLVLNMLMIALLPAMAYGSEDPALGVMFFFIGIVVYFASVAVALSPVGEAILRWQNKCKKIKNPKIQKRIEPLFQEVYQQARLKDPTISENVKFFLSPDPSPNAFATGRKTVCITRGLLELSDNEIKAVLAHEFGHLSNKDTDVILVVAVGNMLITGILTVVSAIVNLFLLISKIFSKKDEIDGAAIFFKIINFAFIALSFIWTKLGVLLCMHSSRKNEFAADAFAVELGYCDDLVEALTTIDEGDYESSKGLWASLQSSHPETCDRVDEMECYKEKMLEKTRGI